MVFNSYVFFLILFPLFCLGFFGLRSWNRSLCKWWIIAASVAFYLPFGVRNVAVLVLSIVFNTAMANALVKFLKSSGECKRPGDKNVYVNVVLFTSLIVNVAVLLFFKFSGVFFPVAISFYTFNQISYLVDLYRGEIEKFEPVDYLCYILFFPKILQGPLMGYEDFVRELNMAVSGRADGFGGDLSDGLTLPMKVDFELVLRGLYLFSMGLFKKVIMADTFGKAVNYGFDNIGGLGSLEAILVAVFYSFQLYFDFSGYCDMGAAICMMIGLELPLNFDSPYKAVNILDFWKRWHITLTRFFTRYVYIPLGGNRKGYVRMYLNFMIVFLLSGLWHGNGWTFIIWGAMHGVMYVITRMAMGKASGKTRVDATNVRSKKKDGLLEVKDGKNSAEDMFSNVGRIVRTLLTFIYVTLAWVFFRADTAKDAITLIGRMFTGGRKPIATQLSSCFQLDELWYVIKVTPIMKLSFAWDTCLWMFLIVAAVMIFFAPNAISISKKCRIGVWTTILTAALLIWSILSFAGVSTFLYMNF